MESARSETIAALAAALAKAQAVMNGAKKDSQNPHFKSKYADLESVWEAAREPLSSHGLSVVQIPGQVSGSTLKVETMLLHESGEYISGVLEIPITKQDAQGIGSAITYARRYALAAFVGIAPEDDDGEGAVGRGKTGNGNGNGNGQAYTPKPADVKPVPPPPAAADADLVRKLRDGLFSLAGGDEVEAENLLHVYSTFEKDGKSFSLKWATLDKANGKWIASTYGKVKKELEAGQPPPDDDEPF